MAFTQVIAMGNLTRDPQLKFTPSQMAVCEFGIAVNEKFKDNERVNFFDCTAFGKGAEFINQYFTKGKPILVIGSLRYESWDDKNGGGKRSKVVIIVERIQFVGGKSGESSEARPAQPKFQADPIVDKVKEDYDGTELAPDDIPF